MKEFDDAFLMEFNWKKICGYYNVFTYEIVNHVLSTPAVKQSIMTYSHYYIGEAYVEDIKYIAIMVTGQENPFFSVTGHYKKVIFNNQNYYGVCLGIDNEGEFFCII